MKENIYSNYDKKIQQKIYIFNKNITEIKDWINVKNFHYSNITLILIEQALKEMDISKVIELNDSQDYLDTEYLIVYKFTNQDNRDYAVIIYDNEELWQEPKIINVYSV